jgi:hypothetical protein
MHDALNANAIAHKPADQFNPMHEGDGWDAALREIEQRANEDDGLNFGPHYFVSDALYDAMKAQGVNMSAYRRYQYPKVSEAAMTTFKQNDDTSVFAFRLDDAPVDPQSLLINGMSAEEYARRDDSALDAVKIVVDPSDKMKTIAAQVDRMRKERENAKRKSEVTDFDDLMRFRDGKASRALREVDRRIAEDRAALAFNLCVALYRQCIINAITFMCPIDEAPLMIDQSGRWPTTHVIRALPCNEGEGEIAI